MGEPDYLMIRNTVDFIRVKPGAAAPAAVVDGKPTAYVALDIYLL
jgi:hypothetical protein